MAKLVLSSGGEAQESFFLERERLSIGRAEACDVRIDDGSVSKQHAQISTVGNDHILEDLQSANGTLVNGRRVKRHILQHNDVIEVGERQLRYINQKARLDVDSERTMYVPAMAGTAAQPTGDAAPAAGPSRASRANFPLAGVRRLAGPRAGERLTLDRVLATFGNADGLAVVTRRPHGYFIAHVSGKRNALVNGKAIGAELRQLQPDDLIEVGEEKLKFFAAAKT